MNRLLLPIICLLLPFIVLGGWTLSLLTGDQTIYRVVMTGYDPLDTLHGRYLRLQYVWDDPRSQKPADPKIKLPVYAQYYVPEYDAPDLEEMLRDTSNVFIADILLRGKHGQIKSLQINDKSWQESLDAWRQKRDNQTP